MVMKYFPKVLSYEDTQQMVQKILNQYSEYGYCFWKVLLKPEDQFVGIAGLLHQKSITSLKQRFHIVYWRNIGEKAMLPKRRRLANNMLKPNGEKRGLFL